MVKPYDRQWLESDLQYAIAYQEWKNSVCGGCGQPLSESLDEDTLYATHVIRCFACQAVESRREKLSADEKNDSNGLKVVAERV